MRKREQECPEEDHASERVVQSLQHIVNQPGLAIYIHRGNTHTAIPPHIHVRAQARSCGRPW